MCTTGYYSFYVLGNCKCLIVLYSNVTVMPFCHTAAPEKQQGAHCLLPWPLLQLPAVKRKIAYFKAQSRVTKVAVDVLWLLVLQ